MSALMVFLQYKEIFVVPMNTSQHLHVLGKYMYMLFKLTMNSPFPGCPLPLHQNKSSGKPSFICMLIFMQARAHFDTGKR